MTGLVYKEWKQNRWFILSMMICSLIPFAALLQNREDMSAPETVRTICSMGTVIAFLFAGGLQTMVLRGDDRKIWGCWITSTPEGYRGFLRVKYEMVFAMAVLFLTSLSFFDRLFCAVMADRGVCIVSSIADIAMPLVFIQLLLRAIDIPFTLRYGNKKGSLIKLIYSVAAVLIISVLILTNFCNFSVVVFNMGKKLFSGKAGSLSVSVMMILSLAAYYLSYRISCRIYLKGVEQYDH